MASKTGKTFKKNASELFLSEEQEAPEKAVTPVMQNKGDVTISPWEEIRPQSKSIRLQVLIRPATKEALKKEADQKGCSVNELINNVLEDHIRKGAK